MHRLFALITALCLAVPAFAVEMGDDGLHKPEWLRDTFKDLQEDFAEATAEGKRVIILVEQRIDAVRAVADRVTFIVNGVAIETLDAATLTPDAEAFRRHVGV